MTQKARGRKRRGRPPKKANAIQTSDQSSHSHEPSTTLSGEFGMHPPDASNYSTSRPREERSYREFFPDLNVKQVLSISVVDEEPSSMGNYEEPPAAVANGKAADERSSSPARSVRSGSSSSSGESNADSEESNGSSSSASKSLKRKRDDESSNALNGKAKRQTLSSDDFDAESSELSSASNIDEDVLQETLSDEHDHADRDPLLTHQKEGDIFQALSTRPQQHVPSSGTPGQQKLGVNLDILPKPSFRKVVQSETDQRSIEEVDEDEEISTSDHPGRYKRPLHYIRYIEPSETELMETIEYDMDEQDEAWLQLLNEERQKENLGEVTADLFEAIIDQLEKEWFDLVKNLPKQVDEEPLLPEDSACAICDDTECENSNAIVFCDGCNLAVHQDCYGVPYIPEGQWLCRKCMVSPENPVSCLFCPNEGGAFKQTNTNKWGHLLCAIWIPEVGLSNSVYMEPIDNIENVPKSRWKLTCYICRRRQGACIQCDNKNCFVAFHVTCARWARLCMRMKSHSSHYDGVVFKAYCDRHTPRDYREQIDVEANVRAAQAFFESSRRDKSGGHRVPRQRYVDTELAQERLVVEDSKKSNKKKSRSNLKANAVAQLLPSSKAARAHQHQYSAGAPIVPSYIISKIEELRCIKQASQLRQKKQVITSICRYWSLKRESRRGAPLLKRLHLEPWTASSSQHKQTEVEKALRATAMMNLRADLERVRLLSEQVQKREKQKLERMRKQKAYLELILFPVEYIMRPVVEQLMELDKKELFRYPVTADVAPDYADIIEKPMSFADIFEKFAAHEYASIDEIQEDLMLIWHNSMTYNKPETIYYRLAEKLEKQTTDLVAKARKDYEELEIKKETGILAAEVHPEIFTYNTVHIPSPEELAAERERVAAEERAKAEEEEKKRIAEEKAQARREAASAKRQAKAAAAELKRQKSRERAAALRAKKAEEMTAKQETEETGTMPKDEKPDVKQDKIADRRRRTRSMGSEGLIAPTPQELENRKSSEARRLVWYSESEPTPIPGDTKGKRKERGWLYLDDDEEIQPRKRVRESTRDSKKANKQDHAVNIKHKQIVWARIRGFPPHPARIIDPNKQKLDPAILASKHASTPVLVEFFEVPEKHQWGWVSSTNVYPFGDPERDKEMLILARKTRNANRIKESQNGYRHACELLGLDPEPALTAFKK